MSQLPQPSLAELQRWLLAAITEPQGSGVFGVPSSLSSNNSDAKNSRPPDVATEQTLDSLILPSSKQSSADRLGIYATAYYLRLVDCLREFFPCLRYAMGDDIFDDFALTYLQKHPSQSYTLQRLADQFATFLQESRPESANTKDNWAEFFVDLARLEHAIEIVFDADGPENSFPLERQSEGSNDSPLAPDSQLLFVPGFQLLAFRYPVSSYYTAWKHGEEPSLPGPQEQFVALFRRDYIVRRHELTAGQHSLLSDLVAGEPLDTAISRIANRTLADDESAETFSVELRDWFERWTRAGFFQSRW